MLHSVTLLYGKTVKIMYNWWQGEANIQRPFSETIPGLSGYAALVAHNFLKWTKLWEEKKI